MNRFSVSGWFVRRGLRALIPVLMAVLATSLLAVAATSGQTGDAPAEAKSPSKPEAGNDKLSPPSRQPNKKAQSNRAKKPSRRRCVKKKQDEANASGRTSSARKSLPKRPASDR